MHTISEKVKVANNERLGWHLEAALELAAGDTILEEQPLMVIPLDDGNMKCAKCLHDSNVMCKKCDFFPLCVDCDEHDEFDCAFFQPNGPGGKIYKSLLVKNFDIFATLKLLLMMENPATTALCNDILEQRVDLDEYHKDLDTWLNVRHGIVAPFTQTELAAAFKRHTVDADFVHKLKILIDSRSFVVTCKDGGALKGVYAHSAKLPHSCIPNTVIAMDYDYKMKVYAATDILPGEVIYNTYVNPMMGTNQRKLYLRMNRNFDCECRRCVDPTELGTFLNAVKCSNCPNGYACCDIRKSSHYKCKTCQFVIAAFVVDKLLAEVTQEVLEADEKLEAYEHIVTKYAHEFHPNHFLLIDLKDNISMLIRSLLTSAMLEDRKKLLERKVEISEEILPVMRKLVPGLSKIFALNMYEYEMAFMELAEHEMETGGITEEIFLTCLQRGRDLADEAIQLLAFEPDNSPEGLMRESIEKEKRRIEENLQMIATVGAAANLESVQ